MNEQKENLITGTWLPVFPGFYGTFFDGEHLDEYEQDFIKEQIEDEKLRECMIENYYNSQAQEELFRDYQKSVSIQCVGIIEGELKPEFVTKFDFEGLRSPKEYNFSNDSINIEVEFSVENIENIKKFIADNFEEWEKYLKDHYSSYSGFMSFHSNNSQDEEWNIEEALKDDHNSGSILEFICQIKNINSEFLYECVESDVGIDIEALEKECREKWYDNEDLTEDELEVINERKLDKMPECPKLF